MNLAVQDALKCPALVTDMELCLNTSCPAPSGCLCSDIPVIYASDPNNLVGPGGVGQMRWIAGAQGLSYVISFENEPNASAPAPAVLITSR